MRRHFLLATVLLSVWSTAAGTAAYKGKAGMLLLDEESAFISAGQIEETVGLLSKTAVALQKQGIRVVFCVVPTKISLFPENTVKGTAYPSDYQTRYAKIMAAFKQAGLQAVDVKHTLEVIKETGAAQPWMLRDSHWTPEAAYLVGTIIGQEIGRLGWARTLKTSPTRITRETVAYPTDLYRLLPASQKFNVPVTESVTVPRRETASVGLLDEGESAVVLVGSSYSRVPYPTLDVGLAAALNTDVLNFGQDGGGLWRGLEAFLKSPSYTKKSARVLVWEMPERSFYPASPVQGFEALLKSIR